MLPEWVPGDKCLLVLWWILVVKFSVTRLKLFSWGKMTRNCHQKSTTFFTPQIPNSITLNFWDCSCVRFPRNRHEIWNKVSKTNPRCSPKFAPKFLMLCWQVKESSDQISPDASHQIFQISIRSHQIISKYTSGGKATPNHSGNLLPCEVSSYELCPQVTCKGHPEQALKYHLE